MTHKDPPFRGHGFQGVSGARGELVDEALEGDEFDVEEGREGGSGAGEEEGPVGAVGGVFAGTFDVDG